MRVSGPRVAGPGRQGAEAAPAGRTLACNALHFALSPRSPSSLFLLALAGEEITTDRPDFVESADVVPHVQIETGIESTHDGQQTCSPSARRDASAARVALTGAGSNSASRPMATPMRRRPLARFLEGLAGPPTPMPSAHVCGDTPRAAARKACGAHLCRGGHAGEQLHEVVGRIGRSPRHRRVRPRLGRPARRRRDASPGRRPPGPRLATRLVSDGFRWTPEAHCRVARDGTVFSLEFPEWTRYCDASTSSSTPRSSSA